MARIFPDDLASRVVALCRQYLRSPIGFATDDATGDPILDFNPSLSAEEQTTYALLLTLARTASTLTPADWAAIQPRVDSFRTFRVLSQSEFMALTANQRDRLLQDAVNDLGAILLRLLRTS